MYKSIEILDREVKEMRRQLYMLQCQIQSGTNVTKFDNEVKAAELCVNTQELEKAIQVLREYHCQQQLMIQKQMAEQGA